MKLLHEFGACDCHSHIYGPTTVFPLPLKRSFEVPDAPLERLESVWKTLGIDRAVLVQGTAYGDDHRALLAALEVSPKARRGVSVLRHTVDEGELATFHEKGIRAVRLNWTQHLLRNDSSTREHMLANAAVLAEKIGPLRWHIEVHIDPTDLELLSRLVVPAGMAIVIDHMARIDLSVPESDGQLKELCELLKHPRFWVKLSGADRLTNRCSNLRDALNALRAILRSAPDRCVWGLDWPHVNLANKRTDRSLVELLVEATDGEEMLKRVLVKNPARLYGFDECLN